MVALVWQVNDDLGIASVDAQHRELFDLVNALAAAEGSEALAEALNRLMIFTKTHFDHEVALFRDTPYPDAERHQKQHGHLMLILKRFAEFCERSPQDVDTLVGFLSGWLMDHIRNDDRAYAAYVLAQDDPYALTG